MSMVKVVRLELRKACSLARSQAMAAIDVLDLSEQTPTRDMIRRAQRLLSDALSLANTADHLTVTLDHEMQNLQRSQTCTHPQSPNQLHSSPSQQNSTPPSHSSQNATTWPQQPDSVTPTDPSSRSPDITPKPSL